MNIYARTMVVSILGFFPPDNRCLLRNFLYPISIQAPDIDALLNIGVIYEICPLKIFFVFFFFFFFFFLGVPLFFFLGLAHPDYIYLTSLPLPIFYVVGVDSVLSNKDSLV